MVVGEGRPYLVALLGLGQDELSAWFRHHGFTDPDNRQAATALNKHLQGIVDDVNHHFSRAERIRKWALVPEGFPPDTMTPTIKLRRSAAVLRFSAEIDRLYSS
jgi:long-chain acyl-CoA synthetase